MRGQCPNVAEARVREIAPVWGRRAEVERRRSGAVSEAQRERNGNAAAADERPPLMRPFELPLVTSAGFAKRNKRGRGGSQGRDRKRAERSKARVGHGEGRVKKVRRRDECVIAFFAPLP